jgi:DNA-directed RNA polymerase subunit RPC12/RpoP
MNVPATTAEWICTRCGSTNRRLVARSTQRTLDRCVHCGSRHVIEAGQRPVRWDARLED